MRLLILLIGGFVSAQANTYYRSVNVGDREFQLVYSDPSPDCRGLNGYRDCLPRNPEGEVLMSVKIVELHKTPYRQWGSDVDSWLVGFTQAPQSEPPKLVLAQVELKC